MPWTLQQDNLYVIPVLHDNMETAAEVRRAYLALRPDCVAVELAETMQLQLLHAASRLPDISVVVAEEPGKQPLYYLCEPCDGAFEGLRSALDDHIAAYCIDLDVDSYPQIREPLPDPYSIQRISLANYYHAYRTMRQEKKQLSHPLDGQRELHMARRLKELSLQHDKVLFVCGMNHAKEILELVQRDKFPVQAPAARTQVQLCTLTEESCREVLGEYPYLTCQYEEARPTLKNIPDRQKILYQLYKDAQEPYKENTGNAFPPYQLRNTMKFGRNYAIQKGMLIPNLFQLLSAAKGCVDHNYAYEVWELATSYPHLRNVDNLPELPLTAEEVWGQSQKIRFHLRQQKREHPQFRRRPKKGEFKFKPPGPFTICSFPPEDLVIENFGRFLQKKGTQLLMEEAMRTIPFSTSLEDGIDTRETIRHWHEKTLYVKVRGKPPGGVGSVVVVFDEDKKEEEQFEERYPWCVTWHGEHDQESDMAFYATEMGAQVVGPGISRCEYGGFMMTYPPRRLHDVWHDPDYSLCRSKAEVLLMAAIDYAEKPLIVYVAAKPPRSFFKSLARRFGYKLVYLPIGQLSPVTLNKLRVFHVLDGHDKREIADEYIF